MTDGSTKWAQLALRKMLMVCFVEGRLPFVPGVGQESSTNRNQQAVFYRGDRRFEFEACFSSFGVVVTL